MGPLLFEPDNEEYCEPVRISHVFNDNYIGYKSNGDKDKTLSVKECLDKIRPYFSDMINDLKTQGERKIQSTIAINIFSSKNSRERRTMHSKSNNIEIVIVNETDEIIEELFDSLLLKFQKGLEESMKGSKFVFDRLDLLHYKCHKISLNRIGSYIDSPKWLKNNKATVNPKNNDYKCFQYAIAVALNHKSIVKKFQRISKIKLFINKHNWKEINFPSHKNDWKKFETSNKTIPLNTLYVPHNMEEIRHAYISNHNSTRDDQVTLLMITDGKKWHYLAVKILSALFREIT